MPLNAGVPREPPRFFLQASPESPVTPARSISPVTGWKEPSFMRDMPSRRGSVSQSLPHASGGIEQLDALTEIHRVLYRGREDMDQRDGASEWEIQGKELKRVIDRWFEGDCIYEHPLARVSSRQSLLAHFALLNLLSTMYLPTLTPTSLFQHLRGVLAYLGTRSCSSGGRGNTDRALDTAGEEEILGLKPTGDENSAEDDLGTKRKMNWWKLYDFSADCKEIGAMETYDGYHLAMIEQVISLTFFPSLLPRDKDDLSCTSKSTSDADFLTPASLASPSFSRRLALAILREISDVLRWDIPLCTTVHFNEVGKATHIKDSIDVRDVIETFVPFAKRINWLSRRLTGALTSTLGAIALRAVDRVIVGGNTSSGSEKIVLEKNNNKKEITGKSSTGVIHSTSPPSSLSIYTTTPTDNLLGLGVDRLSNAPHAAPDVDRWA